MGTPVHLSGRPFAATNLSVVHTLHIAIQPTFD